MRETVEKTLNARAFALAVLIALGALLSGSILLPHDRYFRFQAHDNVTTRKSDWIYERLHFDPTPIDVALIGTSRMGGGLSGPLIERRYCEAVGRRIHVANLSIPVTGRNMHYLIAKEAARAKTPSLTIFELNDSEARRPHHGFIFLADAQDVLNAPLFINTHFFSDLIRLPGRQAALFIQTILRRPDLRAQFDPNAYRGPNLDLTELQIATDGRVQSRRVTRPRAVMNALRARRLREAAPFTILPAGLRDLEYRYSRRYLARARKAVEETGGAAAFAYLPAYGEPAPPPELLAALRLGAPEIELGGPAALDPSLFLDATHFNAEGAVLASRRFADRLAELAPRLGDEGPC